MIQPQTHLNVADRPDTTSHLMEVTEDRGDHSDMSSEEMEKYQEL